MSLKTILNKVAAESGIDISDANQRAWLVEKINEAARDIYSRSEIPVALKECYVRATPNMELALPPFIGEIRAIRSGCLDYCTEKWQLQTMWPRYNKAEWPTLWKNWRLKGYTSVAIEWLNSAPGTITYPEIDPELTVSIVGETVNSNRSIDIITMDALSKEWTKTFTTINKITKNKITNYNVVLTDADGNECAIIYADQLEARYMLMDVSKYPERSCCSCDDGSMVMEVLYKPRLGIMQEDDDFFPVDGFDDLIVLKAKQLLTELQEGKEERAILMQQKGDSLLKQYTEDKIATVPRKLTFKSNPFFNIPQ